jgi:tyrosine-protein kinase Etk/Wzc
VKIEQPISLPSSPSSLDTPGPSVARGAGPPRSPVKEEDTAAKYVATLFESRYFIAASVLVTVTLSLAYVLFATPTWESEALVQIEDRNKTLAGLEDLSSILSEKNLADSEMELIRSRSLLGSVVDQLNLTIEATPRTFPLIGGAAVRLFGGPGVAPARLALSSYGWGGEECTVTRLDLPDKLVGRSLELVAKGDHKFELLDSEGRQLVAGEIGKAAQGPDGISIFVRQLVARPDTRFNIRLLWRDAVIDSLKAKVRVAERVKKTGIITISLAGTNRVLIPKILDAIAQGYELQNVQRKSAEAAKTLEFIEEQLPALKTRVDTSEKALNAFQQTKGTVDLSAETQSMLDRTVEIEKALSDLELQRSDLAGRFAEAHPLLTSIRQKAEKLRMERTAVATKMKNVPEQELDSARLTRDVKVSSELYFLLLNKAQELRVVKSGTLGNVRIIDPAVRPHEPSSPKPLLSCVMGLLLGLVGGTAIAFVRRSIHGGVDDPDVIESLTGLPIYAAIPHSTRQAGFSRTGLKRDSTTPLLAAADPADTAIEALRSLRTNLQFALIESRNNIIVVSGPAPGIGKSFVCCNFGHILAAAGQQVLLIDGDFRRGRLHRVLGGGRTPGLSDILAGEARLSDAVRATRDPNLHFLSCGTHRPNPSEMLGSARLKQFLEVAAKSYELVLVDTPPVLAVTDAALIGRYAGVNILVLRAGDHSAREIKLAVKSLHHAGVELKGVVINDAAIGPSRYGRFGQYGYYQYDYTPEL